MTSPPAAGIGLDRRTVGLLRAALTEAGYTVDGVAALLGPVAQAALGRNETTPAWRATGVGSPLATLTRLWPLQAGVPVEWAERALPGLVGPLCATGVLARSVGEVRALLDLRPYADEERDWWLLSDLTPGLDGGDRRVGVEHVLGVGSASTTLAQLTVRDPVGSALDLGTGCGVQALHLSTHSTRVVGTDVNPRALAMARTSADLNRVDLDLRAGSLFEPVAGERFDLVTTNPPFVVSAGTAERLVYRDSGLPGDEVVRRIVTQAPRHLNPGGWCQVLANWAHHGSQPWQERLRGWVEPTGCDAWVVQREVVDPTRYVELWLADAGLHGAPDYRHRYDTWLAWFDEQGIEAVGFGWLNLRRSERTAPVLRIEEWPYDVQQPLAPEVVRWGRSVDWLADHAACDGADDGAVDDRLLGARLCRAEDITQETHGEPGAEDPERIVLRQGRGMRRARVVDTTEAAVVGACDGELTVGHILDAVASLLQQDPAAVRRDQLPRVRELVAEGWLAPEAPVVP